MKDTYYFSHDANALSDPKILSMRCDYGLEGYGLYWAIIELLRNESNYKLSLNKTTYRAIKIQTGTSIDVEKFIENCINEYIDSETGTGLFTSDGTLFWSASLLRRMNKYEELKEKRSKAANARWNKNKEKNASVCKSKRKLCKCNTSAYKKIYKCNANSRKVYAKLCKLNEIKLNKNKIYKLNKIKLDLLFNFINGTEKKFENLTEADRQSILTTLKRLELETPETVIKYLSKKQILYSKIHYWIIKEIYLSPYKTYLNSLNKNKFIFKFLLAKKYINIDDPTEENVNSFIKYFIKCLQDEMLQENKICIKT